MEDARRLTGTVKWFSGQKGFGFVEMDDGGEDLFVHQTEIQSEGFRTLREGQRVEFKVDIKEDGRSKAVDVVILQRNYTPGARRGYVAVRGDGRGRGRGGDRGGRFGGGYGGERGGDGVECYNCGRTGHLARDCYHGGGGGGDGGYRGQSRGGGGSGGRGRGRGGRECYNCGEGGHFARDCPVDQN